MVSDTVIQAVQLLVFIGFFGFSAICLVLIERSSEQRGEFVKKYSLLHYLSG